MNEPEPPFGTVECAADNLAQLAGAVIAHASVVQTYAGVGYWPGLALAARTTAAYLRAMDAGIAELERSRALVRYRTLSNDPTLAPEVGG